MLVLNSRDRPENIWLPKRMHLDKKPYKNLGHARDSKLNYTVKIQLNAEWRLKGSILLMPIYKTQVITLDKN